MDNYGVLAQLNIEEVVNDLRDNVLGDYEYLRDMKVTGDNVMITCPYHAEGKENNPSMGVSIRDNDKSKKGTCHCFTCNVTTDLLTLISFVNGVHDNGQFGTKWVYKNYMVFDLERKPINIAPKTLAKEKTYVSNTVVLRYAEKIPEYILNRGISLDVASYFNVGYDKNTNSATFPVYGEDGKCSFIQRRSIDYKFFANDEDAQKGDFLYGYYQLVEQLNQGSSILDLSKLYVVESIIDALYLWSYGYSAVATMQATPTKEQLKLIQKLPIPIVVAAQDNDNAGKRGAKYLKKHLKGKLVERLLFPSYAKDVNDISRSSVKELSTTIIF